MVFHKVYFYRAILFKASINKVKTARRTTLARLSKKEGNLQHTFNKIYP